jgi:hypothetical protein
MGFQVVIETPTGTSKLPDIYPDEASAEQAGEAWANGLGISDEEYRANYGYDLEETPDWEALKADVRPWKVFHDVSSSDEMDASDVAKGFKDGYEDILSYNIDYIFDQGLEGANQILRDNGFDPSEWQDDPGFDELRTAIENAADFNISAIAPSTLFIRMDDEIEVPDMSDPEGIEEARQLLLPLALKHGFDKADLDDVLANATYGGSAGVGVLAPGEDIIEMGMQNADDANRRNFQVRGRAILYCTDSMNGSGYYTLGGQTTITVADLAESIDYGKYSLGAVFGTSEWNYR